MGLFKTIVSTVGSSKPVVSMPTEVTIASGVSLSHCKTSLRSCLLLVESRCLIAIPASIKCCSTALDVAIELSPYFGAVLYLLNLVLLLYVELVDDGFHHIDLRNQLIASPIILDKNIIIIDVLIFYYNDLPLTESVEDFPS